MADVLVAAVTFAAMAGLAWATDWLADLFGRFTDWLGA